MEKPKEKTPEQIFGEKFTLQENNTNQTPTVKKESFPWIQNNTPNNQNDTANYTKYLEELLERSPIENPKLDTTHEMPRFTSQTGSNISIKKIDQSKTIPEDNIVKSIQRAALDEIVKYQKIINSLSIKISEYEQKIKSFQPEITQYQNVINSLRLEIETHKNAKPHAITSEVTQYQKLFKALKDENMEYKRKIESIQPEIIRYQQIINSLKSDLEQYKNARSQTIGEGIQYQQLIYSLKAELAEYRNKMELLSAERNQQNQIDSLKAELAEYRNKMELLSCERNQQNQIDSLKAELAEYKKIKISSTDLQHENTMKMLNAEIARLKS